jgi:hypothetical protein
MEALADVAIAIGAAILELAVGIAVALTKLIRSLIRRNRGGSP